jgi:multiple sugar transport system ATP-binding protein
MTLLNLEKYANNKPGELSGGQQQRISLGRALIRDASIYLLDEPLSHLDAHEKVDLRVQLQRIQKLNKLTFILVTHDQLEALEMSDRILVMNHGQMQQIGTPEELYDNPRNLFVADFIGEPPMNFAEGKLLPMTVGKYIIKCRTTQFEITPANGKDLATHSGKKVVMGIRPEHISLCDSTTENSMEGLVFSYEDLGEKGYVLVNCSEEKFLVEKEGGVKFELDEKVYIRFHDQEVYLFDADDGERIL